MPRDMKKFAKKQLEKLNNQYDFTDPELVAIATAVLRVQKLPTFKEIESIVIYADGHGWYVWIQWLGVDEHNKLYQSEFSGDYHPNKP